MRSILPATAAAVALASTLSGQLQQLRPGFNLFTPEQDIRIGAEARPELERNFVLVRNRAILDYITDIGRRLAASPFAGTFPFSFHVVNDGKINAFSLPGGPIYLNTGAILACANEAQLAGVMAHEMSHVALRHGTSQLSRQDLIELPAVLADDLVGEKSMLARLARLGIGFGTSSVLLRFSRANEAQADYNGAEIMADAGYDPIEMARFFETIEAQDPEQGALEQFLADHPRPGNRVTAVEEEVRAMPPRSWQEDSPRFHHIRDLVAHLPAPPAHAQGGQ